MPLNQMSPVGNDDMDGGSSLNFHTVVLSHTHTAHTQLPWYITT